MLTSVVDPPPMTGPADWSADSDRVQFVAAPRADGVHYDLLIQIVALNGRRLATSTATFPDEAAARTELAAWCQRVEALGGSLRHAANGPGWVWWIHDGAGRTILRSDRTYERHDSCHRALSTCLAALQVIAATPNTRVLNRAEGDSG